jgi:hypothetical protein
MQTRNYPYWMLPIFAAVLTFGASSVAIADEG